MAKLQLTNGKIIETGLALSGRPDLTTESRVWLSLFLEEFYYTQDVEWLVKTLDDQALSDGLAFPTDYRAAKSASIENGSGSKVPVDITYDSTVFDAAKASSTDSTGMPTLIWADQDNRLFYFNPAPSSGLTLNLKYYYIPDIADYSDADVFDADVPKWELPFSILVDFIKAVSMEYNDDGRQGEAFNKVMARVAQSKLNARDVRGGSSRMKMGKRFRSRYS